MLSKIARTTGLFALVALPIQLHSQPSSAQTSFVDCKFAGNTIWEGLNDLISAVPFAQSIETAAKTGIALSKIVNNVACNSQGVAGLTLEELTEEIENIAKEVVDATFREDLTTQASGFLEEFALRSDYLENLENESAGAMAAHVDDLNALALDAAPHLRRAGNFGYQALYAASVLGATRVGILKLAYLLDENRDALHYFPLIVAAAAEAVEILETLEDDLQATEFFEVRLRTVDRGIFTRSRTIFAEVFDLEGDLVHSEAGFSCVLGESFPTGLPLCNSSQDDRARAKVAPFLASENRRVRSEILSADYRANKAQLERPIEPLFCGIDFMDSGLRPPGFDGCD